MLGDLDLGLHLVRTQALRTGESLSAVTARLADAAGLATALLPATDDPLRTSVVTPDGAYPFQEWFVARRHEDQVDAMVFSGAETARPAPGVVETVRDADAVVVAPSNPYTSIHPILAVEEIREAVAARRSRTLALSPLVGGRAVKGPRDRMLTRKAGGTTPAHVAACYEGLIGSLVIDRADAPAEAGLPVVVTDTLMPDRGAARRLAAVVLEALA
jgi:LPPG:FO 2-phospho-L-lactate transferase